MKVKVSTSPTQSEFEEIDLTLTTRRGTECLIGRSPDSDLVLDSTDVSRLHGKFFAQAGKYYFCDVGSRNGSIVNGKLAEKDHSYQLKDGDIIRIGDFVLMLEDEILDTQQAETVVRIINPSVFSNWRQQNPSTAPQELQPVNNESDSSVPAAEISNKHDEPEIVNTSEEIEKSEETVIQPEDIVIPDNAIHSLHGTSASDVPLQGTAEVDANESDSIVQALDQSIEHDNNAHKYTLVQADDIASAEYETGNIPNAESDNEVSEHTIVQADNISSAEHETESITNVESDNEVSEHTIVQADNISSAEHETESITNVESDNEVS
ncbi:MAG: FHA domain-containing protein, partial [Nostoc sp.]|uniref:FHA domain-containing protein n=1 Tax=Nostoc sp. TaxID=1180 RepID=UPI002FFC9A0D